MVVFAGLAFSGQATSRDNLHFTLLAFFSFCFASSAVYLFNDLQDRERDREHPTKKNRPIASGKVTPAAALLTSLGLALGALLLLHFHLASALPAIAAYLVLQVLYSLWLKHIVLLDAFCIAAGFLLRVLAGVWAIGVPLSPWLVVCTVEIALFLALCKRKAEIVSLGEDSSTRPLLRDYAGPVLDLMIGVVASATAVTYALYTLLPSTLLQLDVAMDSRAGQPGMIWTLPFVFYGILRYLHLVYQKDRGENPNRLLFTDGPLLVAIAGYACAVAKVIYF
jgi:4-hydroxybenzoate polyprenyltransferase